MRGSARYLSEFGCRRTRLAGVVHSLASNHAVLSQHARVCRADGEGEKRSAARRRPSVIVFPPADQVSAKGQATTMLRPGPNRRERDALRRRRPLVRVPSPARGRAFAERADVVPARVDSRELPVRRFNLVMIVLSPAGDAAIGPDAAGESEPGGNPREPDAFRYIQLSVVVRADAVNTAIVLQDTRVVFANSHLDVGRLIGCRGSIRRAAPGRLRPRYWRGRGRSRPGCGLRRGWNRRWRRRSHPRPQRGLRRLRRPTLDRRWRRLRLAGDEQQHAQTQPASKNERRRPTQHRACRFGQQDQDRVGGASIPAMTDLPTEPAPDSPPTLRRPATPERR